MSSFLTYGDWQRLNVRLDRVYCRPVLPQYRQYRNARRNGWSFWIVKRGRIRIHWDRDHEAVALPGQVMQPPPLPARVHDFSEDAELLSVRWLADWSIGLPLFEQSKALVFPLSQYPELIEQSHQLSDAYSDIFESFEQKKVPVQMSLAQWPRLEQCFFRWIEYWINMMVTEGMTVNRPEILDPRVHHAIRLIQGIQVNGPVPYGQLCRATELSRVQLDRLFRRYLGLTPKDYLNQCIFNRVADEIFANRLTCAEISEMFGFSSQSHFSRWFQNMTRLTPLQYRKSHLVFNQRFESLIWGE